MVVVASMEAQLSMNTASFEAGAKKAGRSIQNLERDVGKALGRIRSITAGALDPSRLLSAGSRGLEMAFDKLIDKSDEIGKAWADIGASVTDIIVPGFERVFMLSKKIAEALQRNEAAEGFGKNFDKFNKAPGLPQPPNEAAQDAARIREQQTLQQGVIDAAEQRVRGARLVAIGRSPTGKAAQALADAERLLAEARGQMQALVNLERQANRRMIMGTRMSALFGSGPAKFGEFGEGELKRNRDRMALSALGHDPAVKDIFARVMENFQPKALAQHRWFMQHQAGALQFADPLHPEGKGIDALPQAMLKGSREAHNLEVQAMMRGNNPEDKIEKNTKDAKVSLDKIDKQLNQGIKFGNVQVVNIS